MEKFPLLLPFPASYKKHIFHQKQVCACVEEGLGLLAFQGILSSMFLLFDFMQHFEIFKCFCGLVMDRKD